MLKVLSICAVAGLVSTVLAAAVSGQGQPPPQDPAAKPTPPPAQWSADLKVGDMAPDFALPGSDGKVHKLSAYRGKHVVIAWFPKAFTGG